jgi:hypothetical protein
VDCSILYAVCYQADALTLPGGAISKETQLFLSTVLAPMMQGAWQRSAKECVSGAIAHTFVRRLRPDRNVRYDGDYPARVMAARKRRCPRPIDRVQVARWATLLNIARMCR